MNEKPVKRSVVVTCDLHPDIPIRELAGVIEQTLHLGFEPDEISNLEVLKLKQLANPDAIQLIPVKAGELEVGQSFYEKLDTNLYHWLVVAIDRYGNRHIESIDKGIEGSRQAPFDRTVYILPQERRRVEWSVQ